MSWISIALKIYKKKKLKILISITPVTFTAKIIAHLFSMFLVHWSSYLGRCCRMGTLGNDPLSSAHGPYTTAGLSCIQWKAKRKFYVSFVDKWPQSSEWMNVKQNEKFHWFTISGQATCIRQNGHEHKTHISSVIILRDYAKSDVDTMKH